MATINISEVKRYICEHIGEIHTIQDVSRHFEMTDTALSHQWKRVGEQLSLGRFIEWLRIHTALSIHWSKPSAFCKEIAHDAGYRSVDVASRSFKRITGQSMRQNLLAEHSFAK